MSAVPSLYIHIPFCVRKCLYCDFYSFVPSGRSEIETYIAALRAELDLYREYLGGLKTVYIGGGTPSMIDNPILENLFSGIDEFTAGREIEFTLEANPDDVTPEKAEFWKRRGVTRASLGWQSMDKGTLGLLRRRNSPEVNRQAFDCLRGAGFGNISVDLILSVAGGEIESALDAIAELTPEHVSAYHLTIEEGTPLHRMTSRGEYVPRGDSDYLAVYHNVSRTLETLGYRQYEVSNFARPGFESRHNTNYWDYGGYAGIGLGAAGFIDGTRYTNTRDMKEYLRAAGAGERPVASSETPDRNMAMREYVMLGLRKADGFSADGFFKRFGVDLNSAEFSAGWAALEKWVRREGGRIFLTPGGRDIMDGIIGEIWDFLPESR